MFGVFARKNMAQDIAGKLYEKIMEQSRLPVFFTDYKVPDTTDGRFELILLHSFLVFNQLEKQGAKAVPVSQVLFDVLFRDMDCAVREMGVGDLSVRRHMKRMWEAFKGRIHVYGQAVREGRLNEALARNLYGTVERPPEDILDALDVYINDNIAFIADQNVQQGEISFSSPPSTMNQEASRIAI